MHYHWDLAMVLADTDRWWHGIGITLLYSVATVAGGILIGVSCGLALLGQKRWLTLPLEGYVEIFRCTPLLIQIVWFYYALPGRILHRDFSCRCDVDWPRPVASRPRTRHDLCPADASDRAAAGSAPNDSAARQPIDYAAEEHSTSLRRGGARPDVYELDHHRRDLSPPRGLHDRGGHIFHNAVPADAVREKAGDLG